jgi:hypothetical protein
MQIKAIVKYHQYLLNCKKKKKHNSDSIVNANEDVEQLQLW